LNEVAREREREREGEAMSTGFTEPRLIYYEIPVSPVMERATSLRKSGRYSRANNPRRSCGFHVIIVFYAGQKAVPGGEERRESECF